MPTQQAQQPAAPDPSPGLGPGTAVTQAVTGIFTAAVRGQGARLQVDDLVPLSAEDPRGFSGFYVIFGVTLAGFIFGQTSHLYSKGLPLGHTLIQALGFAVLVGLATALVTRSFTALLGDPGIVLATLLLVILGNATDGGVVAASFLPGGFRQLSPALPTGAATDALRRVDYFDPAAALGPVAVLAVWALAGLFLLVVMTGRRRALAGAVLAEQAHVAP